MKVKDLINVLCGYNVELDVCIPGYEGGLSDLEIENIGITGIDRDANRDRNYVGNHAIDIESSDKVLLLSRWKI